MCSMQCPSNSDNRMPVAWIALGKLNGKVDILLKCCSCREIASRSRKLIAGGLPHFYVKYSTRLVTERIKTCEKLLFASKIVVQFVFYHDVNPQDSLAWANRDSTSDSAVRAIYAGRKANVTATNPIPPMDR